HSARQDGMALASISRCFLPMPPRSNSVCSTNGANANSSASLPEYTDEVWHGYFPSARPGTVCAYRVHGPSEPDADHRFNPNKLVIDPYAKQLVGRLTWGPELFAYQFNHADKDRSFDS